VLSSELSNASLVQPKVSLRFVLQVLSTDLLVPYFAMSECYLNTNAISSWRCDPPDTNIKALSLNYEQAVDLIKYSIAASTCQNAWYSQGFIHSELKLLERSPEDLDLLLKYFHIFSETFFLGILTTTNCPIEFILKGTKDDPRWTDNKKSSLNMRGYARGSKSDKQSRARSDIFIFEDETTNLEDRFRQYLQTLAHEMTHSFLEVFVCRCRHKCGLLQAAELGLTGHGLAWQRCAQRVENFLKKYLHPEAHLSRNLTMSLELSMTKKESTTMPLQELRLDKEEVDKWIPYFAAATAAARREVQKQVRNITSHSNSY